MIKGIAGESIEAGQAVYRDADGKFCLAPGQLSFKKQLDRIAEYERADRAGCDLVAQLERLAGRKLDRDENMNDVLAEIERKNQ